jgi:ABC-type multidrug transport system, permease component
MTSQDPMTSQVNPSSGSVRTATREKPAGLSMKGLRSLSRAMALGFVRDRTAMFFTILMPLMFLVIFGLLFRDAGGSRAEIIQVGPVAVLDQMPASARAQLDQVLEIEKSDDIEAALEDVRAGNVDAVVEQQGTRLVVHYSAADQVSAGTVQAIMREIVQGANLAASPTPPQFTFEARQVEDESLKPIQYLTPGLLGWAVATGAMFGAALTLVTWRQKKVLRRLRLSPVSTPIVSGARIGVSIVVALVQGAIFVAVASLPVFGLRLAHYWWMSIPLLIVGTLAFFAIGQLAGSFTKTPEAASAVANLIVLPMAFLSGAFFPLQNAPDWLNAISNLLPLRHLVEGLLDVMVRGQGPSAVLPELGILFGFAVVVGSIAVALFRWDDA